ncbi:MAG: tRNA (adenosine(37)-N6)-threonylcarbamoyltransferase complex ATPase subunit type 1 TsaE [Ancalomicrobiaceae bacterium]|nr:tRNA (adenosine(37)-N6)-threonylcarbamoyltransferase complex ATPase subunit type 1 TsaE [Ancalomicrobiaceae bacterium]
MAEPVAWASRTIALADEAATVLLAEDLAAILSPGDVIRLEGDLGSGKTAFARALIRAVADDAELEVPSPTFTLVQVYDFPRFAIAHFDLYRLGDPQELDEIGFDEAIRSGAALIEWPERAEGLIPEDALTLSLSIGSDPNARLAVLSGSEHHWGGRLARTLAVRDFLQSAGLADARRRHLKSDASARALERVRHGDACFVLMNHPPETDDAEGRARVAWRAAAKLAEGTRPFVALARGLGGLGLSAPRIDAHDAVKGFVLMEDLGDQFVAEMGAPVPTRYRTAVELLASLHGRTLPAEIADGEGGRYRLPLYSADDLLSQLDPFLDWAVLEVSGRGPTPDERTEFAALWRPLIDEVAAGPTTWGVRDFHSPNLLWLPERVGIARIGLIDFQDAAFLHPAYDVASLAEDARVTVPEDLENELIAHYCDCRRLDAPGFSPAAFGRAYRILAALRASRILGVFARLARRDGRLPYLEHYPRITAYLSRSLAHPALAGLRLWYERHGAVA